MTDPMTDHETPDPQTTAEAAEAAPTLEEQLDSKQEEITALNDKILRLAAEMENTRRRLEKDKVDASAYAVSSFARDILSVADNLRRALDALPEAAHQDKLMTPLITGVEMTEKELLAVFARYGVMAIKAEGARLDPNLHQAVATVESDAQEPGTVLQVFQSGYMIKDRLLRPAMVTVAKAKSGAAPGERVDTTA